jgi:hypothetical protein
MALLMFLPHTFGSVIPARTGFAAYGKGSFLGESYGVAQRFAAAVTPLALTKDPAAE